MARKKAVKTRTKTRTIFKKIRARASNKNTIEKVFAKLMVAATYGALRPMIAEKISPLVKNIPAGQYADEVGMLILTATTSRYAKGIIKDVADAGFSIEAAFLGQQLGANLLMNNNSSTPAIRSF